MNRRRYVTLLELLIALTLASALFSGLFYQYYYMNLNQQELQKKKGRLDQINFLQARLAAVFLKINGVNKNIMNKNEDQGKRNFFLSEDGSLIFTYDNQNERDPRFSNVVLAKLSLKNSRLYLTRWPLEMEEEESAPEDLPRQTELLFEGVQELTFQFSSRKENAWLEDWPIGNKMALPDFLRLNFKFEKEKNSSMVFQLRNSLSHRVEYERL